MIENEVVGGYALDRASLTKQHLNGEVGNVRKRALWVLGKEHS